MTGAERVETLISGGNPGTRERAFSKGRHGRERRADGASWLGQRGQVAHGVHGPLGGAAAAGDRSWGGVVEEGPGGAVLAARPVAIGGEQVGFRRCEGVERIREGRGSYWTRLGAEGNTPATTRDWRRPLDIAMPCSASPGRCQKRHRRVSSHWRLQTENGFATK